MPPDRLNFANLIPSEKGVPNPNIPKKEKRPPKAKAYELIRLAFLLRHDKEAFEDGRIDKHGWRQVSELAQLGYARSLLDEIVATNNKQRYELGGFC